MLISQSVWIAVVILAAGLVFAAGVILARQMAALRSRLEQAGISARAAGRELDIVLQLNHELIQARDEQTLVQAALCAVNNLAGGVGCSYVPFDAWGQPLPAFTFGSVPDLLMKGWADHLASEQVRSRCSKCKSLYAAPDQECPLHIGPLTAKMAIYCLPLALGERRLGMVNLYLAPGKSLAPETHRFLDSLMAEMAFAVEAMRLREQEISTLRYVHRLRTPRMDLTGALEGLLAGARESLLVDGLEMRVRPMSDERISNLKVQAGVLPFDLPAAVESDRRRVLEAGQPGAWICADGLNWLVEPLLLPDGQVLGTLLVMRREAGAEASFSLERRLLQMTAAQVALMVENERATLSMEYTLIIQERTRLAREIHDGLAQTIAFLKLQGAQMQSALNNGDEVRLARLLQENRSALSEAYKETRQAIDHLRLSLDQGLLEWLDHAALDFEKATGLHVDIAVQVENLDLAPEIQVQLVRIIQEALNNVRKHAHANRVCVSLRRWEKDLILEVVDDGQGFDPEDVPLEARYGLRGMRERADLIGGEFQIISKPASGTTVRFFVPGQAQEIGS